MVTGSKFVVSLLESEEAAQLGLSLESKIAASSDVRMISFPVPDRGLPIQKRLFWALCSKELVRNWNLV